MGRQTIKQVSKQLRRPISEGGKSDEEERSAAHRDAVFDGAVVEGMTLAPRSA